MPKSWRTANCARGPCARRSHRPLHLERRGRRDLGAALHVPRLPLCRDQWLARRTSAVRSARVVCHSDLERTGWFECSDPLLNRLHENAVWSMRGNFLDVPTDCPQRDERLGWTGDIQFFSPTACFLYDSAGFLASWLADLAADQGPDGAVPFVVPNVLHGAAGGPAAGWGDAAVVVPVDPVRAIWRRSASSPPSMTACAAWVDHLAAVSGAGRLWSQGFQFGDWLDPAAPPEDPAAARTDPGWSPPPTSRVRPRSLGRCRRGARPGHRRGALLCPCRGVVATAFARRVRHA